jgi:translation initiation factor 3 subunit B
VRKNLRNYSKTFDEQDSAKKSSANKAVVEHRRRLLSEWLAWRQEVEKEVEEEKEMLGIEDEVLPGAEETGVEEVEEIVEEIIDEKEEVVQ